MLYRTIYIVHEYICIYISQLVSNMSMKYDNQKVWSLTNYQTKQEWLDFTFLVKFLRLFLVLNKLIIFASEKLTLIQLVFILIYKVFLLFIENKLFRSN